jgi:DNA-directed RNA polymerase specialized sigma24 family protein
MSEFFADGWQKKLLSYAFWVGQDLPDTQMLDIDYERLLYRLVGKACHILDVSRFAAGIHVVDGLGKSADDFAMDTLILFLEGKLEFSGDENGLYGYLAQVMGNDIVDGLRSKARTSTKKVAPVSGEKDQNGKALPGLDDFDSGSLIHQMVEGDIFKQKLYALFETEEPELYELVFAVFEENAYTPREIAAVIGTTPADVQNRKKRFKTFLAKHDGVFSEERMT